MASIRLFSTAACRAAGMRLPMARNGLAFTTTTTSSTSPLASYLARMPSHSAVQRFNTSASSLTCSSKSSLVSLAVNKQASLFTQRSFHTTGPSRQTETKRPDDLIEAIANTIRQSTTEEIYHASSWALAVLTPTAFILSPSFLNIPVDLALGIIIPVHAHIGMTSVLTDYVPRPHQRYATAGLVFFTVLLVLGLLKLNLCGTGITDSIKHLWRKPEEQPKKLKGKTE